MSHWVSVCDWVHADNVLCYPSLGIAGPCTQEGHKGVVDLLLKVGADKNKDGVTMESGDGVTPLFVASQVYVLGWVLQWVLLLRLYSVLVLCQGWGCTLQVTMGAE